MARSLRVDVWSDVACPWCYLGKRRLEAALAGFPHKDAVHVHWRAFELDPSAPKERDPSISHTARIARKYGVSVAQAEAMHDRLKSAAEGTGIDFRFDRIRSGNTFDAHRVLHLAELRGCGGAMKERLLRAYFTEGELVSDHATLARLAVEAGLVEDEVAGLLATDAYADAVRADEAEARDKEIQGVPCFVLGGRYAVSGAQSEEVMRQVLDLGWNKLATDEAPAAATEGAACGPEGCA